MKNLLNPKLNAKVLSRSEQKAILGGKDILFCYSLTSGGKLSLFNQESGNPAAAAASVSQGGHWCCKSCDTASWLDITTSNVDLKG
ncbi:hypothetical protein DBR43_07490 [Pedobacter sp. KBW06]|uniref:hypothetical protein n=1 Tax=Pedobacter sp. KBW06 TaxID=2153359 RepID=UPI000F595535|nr:hypothetical protein [Pedobacter sp. KBW06]RQO75201.1 hypothetical protein DBR43_07490 [Pedobacter sp. KBW06]